MPESHSRTCSICDTIFISRFRSFRKYCGSRCRHKAINERYKLLKGANRTSIRRKHNRALGLCRCGAPIPQERRGQCDNCASKTTGRRARVLRAKGSHTLAEWQTILAAFDFKCAHCKTATAKLTKDHVIPLSKGGSDFATNLQPLCRPCNSSKNNKMPFHVRI